jgi:hypothetical protein
MDPVGLVDFNQWIGLREKLNGKIDGFRWRFSLQPIHWDYELVLLGMDQYLLIPCLGEWTSINPSYFDVNYRGTRFWHTALFIWGFPFTSRHPLIFDVREAYSCGASCKDCVAQNLRTVPWRNELTGDHSCWKWPVYTWFTNMVTFHSYVNVYQRVTSMVLWYVYLMAHIYINMYISSISNLFFHHGFIVDISLVFPGFLYRKHHSGYPPEWWICWRGVRKENRELYSHYVNGHFRNRLIGGTVYHI